MKRKSIKSDYIRAAVMNPLNIDKTGSGKQWSIKKDCDDKITITTQGMKSSSKNPVTLHSALCELLQMLTHSNTNFVAIGRTIKVTRISKRKGENFYDKISTADA